MNCPNCGSSISMGNLCDECGCDIIIYRKSVSLSNGLYNKGLRQAEIRDLTGAIESLMKSISYNKKNIEARNLLGLVLFEYGRIADGLKQWIISTALKKEDNRAQAYIDKIQEQTRELEKYSEAISKYNKALECIEGRSEDMAIIQLKRAVELNPSFVDAYNLLTLCYFVVKDKQRAEKCVEKVLEIDIQNPFAIRYFNEINPGKNRIEALKKETRSQMLAQKDNKQKSSVPYLYTSPKKSRISLSGVASVLFFVIGIVCTFAYFSVLVLPQMTAEKDQIIDSHKGQMEQLSADYGELVKESENAKVAYEKEIGEIRTENATINDQLARQERIIKVNTAQNLYKGNNLEDAADILFNLDVTGLPLDIVESYTEMVNKIYPALAQSLYTSGVTHYNRKEYTEAKERLEKAMQYVPSDNAYADDIYYYLGLTAEATEDNKKAVEYYEKVINDYPNSNVYWNANNKRQRLAD